MFWNLNIGLEILPAPLRSVLAEDRDRVRLLRPVDGEDGLQVQAEAEAELTRRGLLQELPVEDGGVAAQGREDEEQAHQDPPRQRRHP